MLVGPFLVYHLTPRVCLSGKLHFLLQFLWKGWIVGCIASGVGVQRIGGRKFFYLFVHITLLVWKTQKTLGKAAQRQTRGTHTHTRDLDLKDPAQQAYRQEDDERKGNDDAQLAFCVLDISPPSVKTQYQKLPTQKALCELDFRRLSFSINDSVPDIHCPYEHY